MERIKIGSGYFRTGYGCQKERKAVIYLIEGFCYAKDKHQSERQYKSNEITKMGYVPVNQVESNPGRFWEVSLHTKEHKPYKEIKNKLN